MSGSAASIMVTVDGLSRAFDVSKPWLNRVIEREDKKYLHAVRNVSFQIERGETFALVGESGSGKSTVARMVVGLLAPSAGQVSIDGTDIHNEGPGQVMTALRRRMQMIFQDPFASLNPRWRVEDLIGEPIRAFKLAENDAAVRKRVGELLELVKLTPEDGRKFPHEFSGGQRQRICIARALASNPDFLVCDEPTSALDVSVQAQILNLMRDLQDQLGLTYLLISHDLSVVKHMSNRIGVMYLGSLVEVADPDTLFADPVHPYTRMLLDAIPDIGQVGAIGQRIEGEIPSPIDPPSGCAFHPRCAFANARCKSEAPTLKVSAAPGDSKRTVSCHGAEERRLPAYERSVSKIAV